MKATKERFSRFHLLRLRRQSTTFLLVNLFFKTICGNCRIKCRRPVRVLAAPLAWLSLGPFAAYATDFFWQTPSGGDWGFNGNWSGGPHPETFSDTASFNEAGSPPLAPVTLVSVQTPPPVPTIGTLNLNVGGFTFQNGTLQLGGAATINVQSHNPFADFAASATIQLFSNATISTSLANSTLSVAGGITGAFGLTKTGPGKVTLSGTNTYSGGTGLNGGILAVNSDGNLGTGALSFNGGTLEALAAGGGITSSKALILNAGGGTFLADAGTASTLSGAIIGTGSWTKTGPGTLTLTGNNTYSGGTTISGGTLQIGNGGTSGSILGDVVDNGTLTFDRSGVLTFAGAISGTGSVTQIGNGTMVLSGNNIYSGGTMISAGTLQAGSAAGFSPNSEFTVNSTLDLNGFNSTIGSLSGTGTVLNNGALAATLTVGNDNSNSTFSGVLENGKSVLQLTKSGTGVLTLIGANTYTGGTTITAGTLQLGNGGTTGSITGNVIDNAILAFDHSDVFTFSGAISGTGSVQQTGTGTTVLTGNNTYTGGTIITAGTLQIGNGGTTGSITGNVIDDGVLAFNRSDSVTFGGVISGTGSLIKQGVGTLTLPGVNTYTGTTTINAGSLIVNGSIASTQTVVNPGGFLAGTGFIRGNLVNSGIVSPGNPLGTLTVSGNYTQNPNGTLSINIGGIAPGQFGLLAVNGHASINGTLQLVRLNSFQLHFGDRITFLTANGGVSGSFATIQNPFISNTIVKAQVSVLADAVQILGTQGDFVTAACNPNSASVARDLNIAATDPRASTLISFLDSQPVGNLCSDFTLIAPEQITAVFNMGVSTAAIQSVNLLRRMDSIMPVAAGSAPRVSPSTATRRVSPMVSAVLQGRKARPVRRPWRQYRRTDGAFL